MTKSISGVWGPDEAQYVVGFVLTLGSDGRIFRRPHFSPSSVVFGTREEAGSSLRGGG